ncbi:Mitogen-activated protein kinase kinase kinase 5 [Camellia lanceoleosa]|uniref:Mitogen-activated protein kinase kinase kinase 5 n=1 Tax=Camellia lanceoleosa TaxID=1840588 RepID=A0ACC0IFH0_9ERIC|nr:Mitogen-activated protein kinase kinase kinase 5 [Camellia lanceoleosa]
MRINYIIKLAFSCPTATAVSALFLLPSALNFLRRHIVTHPNIVQYYGSEIIGDRFYIYLEYVHPGSINKYVHEHCGAITECVVRSFTCHILSGLAYLHSTKTIHRRKGLWIQVASVLMFFDQLEIKISFVMQLSGPAANLSLKGSPYWMALEKDVSSDIALAVDIWSLGCTIIEMLNGKPPWSEYEGGIPSPESTLC